MSTAARKPSTSCLFLGLGLLSLALLGCGSQEPNAERGSAYDDETAVASGGERFRAHEVVVKRAAGASEAELRAAMAKLGAEELPDASLLRELGYLRLRLPPALTPQAAAAALLSAGVVESAEPNYVLTLSKTSDDPMLGQLWGLATVSASAAWDQSTGAALTRVAILDTGTELGHTDLEPNLWSNPDEIPGNGVDDDHNGLVDDVRGWDFANGDADPSDDHGHGTHVAGTVGAMGNNALGVVGVNWRVRLVPIKVCGISSCLTTHFAEGLLYAAKLKTRAANASLGGYHPALSYERAAIQALNAAGGVLVAAAGNDGTNNDAAPHYPSSYDEPNVLSVAASDPNDQRASFSNYGANSVHIAAPGSGILSTYVGNSYAKADGTSMAAPHVAGAVALYASVHASDEPSAIKARVIQSADLLPSMQGKVASGGRLNLHRLLSGATNCQGESCSCGGTSSCAPEISCKDNPCDPLATCTDGAQGVECSCPTGYTGDGLTCLDVDECQEGSTTCSGNAKCENTAGSYSCSCNFGFNGDGTTCSDVDECDQGLDSCFPGSSCKNKNGGYECVCPGSGPDSCASVGEACQDTLNACDANATCKSVLGSYYCNCNAGFVGDGFFCVDVDECVPGLNACSDNATCVNSPGAHKCECKAGYAGDGETCADVDECALGTDNCDENASCSNTVGSYTCSCNAGYAGSGTTCTDVDECSIGAYSCGPVSHCVNTPGGYACACNTGYSGDGTTCSDVDECAFGTDSCDENASCTNTVGSYGCDCNVGYIGNGKTCVDFDECSMGAYVCDPNASCVNLPGSYGCACNAGYQGDGNSCSDIDECTLGSYTCDPNATCKNTPGAYLCNCKTGYQGDGKSCADTDECAAGTDQCSVNADCSNTVGGYDCTCRAGWEGDGKTCSDIDECDKKSGPNDCGMNANCKNMPGAYHCSCKDGFEGNGKECQDADECTTGKHTCNVHAKCTNTHGGYMCACKAGFRGDGKVCEEVDECAEGTDDCDTNATCQNTQSGFSCTCLPGFQGNGKTCTDINECAAGTHDCAPGASCTNTVGGFQCSCPTGTQGDGKSCTDVDECAKGTDDCDTNAQCTNLPGSFSCACSAGFTGNGKSCTDVDECALNLDGCAPLASCTNTPGSFECACPAGYAGDGTSCSDVDECGQGLDNCNANASCTNLPGSFSCKCFAGFTGNGVVCSSDTQCTSTSCDPNAQCTNTATSFSCACNAGFTGDGFVCTDVNECMQNLDNCDANATCTNTPGSFSCACNPGYLGTGASCDLDECAQDLDNCHANATCTNTPGSFSCACNLGYSGNGVNCGDTNECTAGTHDCSPNATCTNTVGSYFCACNSGYSGDGRTCLPPATTVTALDSSGDHTCALLDSGGVRCWGRNNFGQLGYGHADDIGDGETAASVGLVSTGGVVTQLAVGVGHTCVLLQTGKVRCWGRNEHGQLGYAHANDIGDDESPTGFVDVGGTVLQLAAGGEHTCALLSGGKVRCWGLGVDGQLGYANTNDIGDNESPKSAGDVQLGGVAVQVSAGRDHTCARLNTGAVRCWGRGMWAPLGYANTQNVGDNEHPASVGDVALGGQAVEVSAGWFHTCARLSTGTVRCWGYGAVGQLGYASPLDVGDDEHPQSAGDVQLGAPAVQISAGLFHTCARLSSGAVRCWGYGDSGRLGYANTDNIGDDEHPQSAGDVQLGAAASWVVAGATHSCALLDSGSVLCWGNGEFGQLGSGSSNDIGDDETPIGGAPLSLGGLNECALGMAGCDLNASCTDLPLGYACTCAVGFTGNGHSCTDENECSLGTDLCDVNAQCSNTPGSYSCQCQPGFEGSGTSCTDVDECATQANTCSQSASCHNEVGSYYCSCNLGYAGDGEVCTPIGSHVSEISAGGHHSCARLNTGAVRCWGMGAHGQLGYGNILSLGDNEAPFTAGNIDLGSAATQLAAGEHHSCALLGSGALRCWGAASFGQLGYGNTQNIGDNETPSNAGDVPVGGTALQVTAGQNHSCVLLGSGAVRCWGAGDAGRLGYANTQNIGDNETPAQVGNVNLGGVAVQVSAGRVHTCALLLNGAVRCWGFGLYGQLGYGNTQNIGDNEAPSVAGNVALGGGAAKVAAGGHHTCALMLDGSVRCWGLGLYGALGTGNTATVGDNESPVSIAPIQLGGLAVDLVVGGEHSCATLSNGDVRCWGAPPAALGYGTNVNVGDNELPSSTIPLALGGIPAALAAGAKHTCALLSDRVYCWGEGDSGKLGYGNLLSIGDNEAPTSQGVVRVVGP